MSDTGQYFKFTANYLAPSPMLLYSVSSLFIALSVPLQALPVREEGYTQTLWSNVASL